jgi:hypothetical protein
MTTSAQVAASRRAATFLPGSSSTPPILRGSLDNKKEPPFGEPYNHADDDRFIFDALEQPFVKRVQVDVEVAKLARRLHRDVWSSVKLIKADSVHLATAIHHNVTELHTWDGSHLLPLNNTLHCRNGRLLPIVKPGSGDDLPLMKKGGGSAAWSEDSTSAVQGSRSRA